MTRIYMIPKTLVKNQFKDTTVKGLNVSINISKFDLNTLGKVMRLVDKTFDGKILFWKVVSQIDVQGQQVLHKLDQIFMDIFHEKDLYPEHMIDMDECEWEKETIKEILYAFWAWNEKNLLCSSNEVVDVTDFIYEAIRIINLLLEGEDSCLEAENLYEDGRQWFNGHIHLSIV